MSAINLFSILNVKSQNNALSKQKKVLIYSLCLMPFLHSCASQAPTSPVSSQKTTSTALKTLQRSNDQITKYQIFTLSLAIQNAYSVSQRIADQLAPLIIYSAEQHKISPYLLAALIQQESSFRKNAVSSAGAIGLTQVMPQYWRKHCEANLFDEKNNIHCGGLILSQYHQQTNDINKALAYYNVGPTGFEKNDKMRQQGLKYARSVQQYHQKLIHHLNQKNQNTSTHANNLSDSTFNPFQLETPKTSIGIQRSPLTLK